MRLLIRTIAVLALVWIGILLSGYGVLVGSSQNAAGLGLQCKYLTARGISTAQYVHSESGIIGMSNCPVLRKSETTIDNG
ncbi:YobH-like protein [Enterobacter sp. BIGb0383]|uniref:YobH family protein n=1 Tax=unclassified Enterobacter TaxID=2608935 RepID=UPI000F4A26B8|nr:MULTISPECIES: YobH family protein [unclassified Enterobacter]ROP61881.1 YobH-like protein [Enterobacter sp. BIGb0383]ROS12042.1 YobH-like protein [Enterobacter sp. BIGb0359]